MAKIKPTAAGWKTDAEFITEIDPDFLWTNSRIDSFLTGSDRFIIVASKGMGKTLLMRHKRHLIESSHQGVVVIPQGQMADYVNLAGVLPKNLVSTMGDAKFWQDLWMLSITISILLNFPHRISEDERDSGLAELKYAKLPLELLEDLRSALKGDFHQQRMPSSVLVTLLQLPISSREQARVNLPKIYDLYLRCISSACCVFIDSFDQAINSILPDQLEVWCAAQHGLLRAAWELSRHNRHVKIYTTIRQEAYACFRDPEGLNIQGSVLLIEYSSHDLRNIFLTAVRQYEALDTIEDFLGIPDMYNGYLRLHEGLFDYINRHMLGVPRWFMVLGQELSSRLKGRKQALDHEAIRARQKEIANLVNSVSATPLAWTYLCDEMRMFFRGAEPEQLIDELLARIDTTVLSMQSLKRLSETFIRESSTGGSGHPFCLLFNLGLLGYVGKDAGSPSRRQMFKKPYQFNWNYEDILPKDPNTHFLLHPSLHNLVSTRNHRFSFSKVRIGDDIAWQKKDEEKSVKERE